MSALLAAPPVAGAAVEIAGVRRRFGTVAALDGIDLTVKPGTFLVLLGPSGSGKSTLLRAIAGIERVDDGRIALAGRTVSSSSVHLPPERRELAMVFQDYALWPHLTVEQNVAYALRRGTIDRSRRHEAIRDMLARVGLQDRAQQYPDQLSGGQQQRVALARALVARPRIVLFDEPLSNLDADLRERLRVEIATLTLEAGATAIYITHDQTEAFALADDLVVLDHGRIVQRGAPETIYDQPSSPFVARFTGLSATITGTVESRRGDTVRVCFDGGSIQARADRGLLGSDRVQVLIRPSAVSMRHTQDPSEAVFGTVVDRAYRGVGYDHVVETGVGRFIAVRDAVARTRGTNCALQVDPAGAFAFPLQD